MLNTEHDVLTVRGFLHALKNTLRLKRDGLLWCGVPCASTFAGSERVMLRSKFTPTSIVNLYVHASIWCVQMLHSIHSYIYIYLFI